jgi:uncharacterized protein (TIGR02996 family)
VTEDDWLDACADQPDDDLRRSAFADWCEERGDVERAEFIRLRVKLSRVPEREQDQTQVTRARELLVRHRGSWLGSRINLAPAGAWGFVRGLPETLTCYSAIYVGELARSSHLAQLTKLVLYGNWLGDAGAQALAASSHLGRLTKLVLWNNQIGTTGVQALAASSHLARLTALELGNNPIGVAGARTLAASLPLAQLTELVLWNTQIGSAGAQALAASPQLARLRELNLSFNRIEDAGAQALAESSHLAQLTTLKLRRNPIRNAGTAALRQAFGDRVQL